MLILLQFLDRSFVVVYKVIKRNRCVKEVHGVLAENDVDKYEYEMKAECEIPVLGANFESLIRLHGLSMDLNLLISITIHG